MFRFLLLCLVLMFVAVPVLAEDDPVVARAGELTVRLSELRGALDNLNPQIMASMTMDDLEEFVSGVAHKALVEEHLEKTGALKKLAESEEGQMIRSTVLVELMFKRLQEELKLSDKEIDEALLKPEYDRFKGPDHRAMVERMEKEQKFRREIEEMRDEWLKAHTCETMEVNFALLDTLESALTEKQKASPLFQTKDGKAKLTVEDLHRFLEFYRFPGNLADLPANAKQEMASNAWFRAVVIQVAADQKVEKDSEFETLLNESYKARTAEQFYQTTDGEVTDSAVATKEVALFYEENKKNGAFDRPPEIKASHILVKEESEIKEVAEALKKGGDFAKLAGEKSTCPSGKRGGDLGYFTRGQMVKEFEEVAFGLKENEISAPVKTQFGWHIIQLTGRKDAETVPISQVDGMIRQRLLREKKGEHIREAIMKIAGDRKIEVYREKIPKDLLPPTVTPVPVPVEEGKEETSKPGKK